MSPGKKRDVRTETITWNSCCAKLPDDDTTVLVHAPGDDEPVWLGYCSAGCWFTIDGFPHAGITDWAPVPRAPSAPRT